MYPQHPAQCLRTADSQETVNWIKDFKQHGQRILRVLFLEALPYAAVQNIGFLLKEMHYS